MAKGVRFEILLSLLVDIIIYIIFCTVSFLNIFLMIFRFTLDAIDVNLIDKNSALRIQLCPLRFSTCNLHGLQTKQGITALVNSVLIQQYVNSNFPLSRADIGKSIFIARPRLWNFIGSR